MNKFIYSVASVAISLSTVLSLSARSEDRSPVNVHMNQGHNVQVIETGVAAFQRRFEMIERAQRSIDIEYFIYNLDRSGRMFSQALIKKKTENPNIRIRIILDASSTVLQFKEEYVTEMAAHGIEVRYYNPVFFFQILTAQYRDHRKEVIIDGVEAITGGRNIGDEYFDLHKEFNFRDRDIWIRGPIVSEMQKSFEQFWANKHVKTVAALKRPERSHYHDQVTPRGGTMMTADRDFRRDLAEYNKKHDAAVDFMKENEDDRAIRADLARVGRPLLDNPQSKGVCPRVQFVTDDPGFDRGWNKWSSKRHVRDALLERADQIRNQHIYVESPYFIAQEKAQGEIIDLAQRDVKMTILTNSLASTDAFYVAADFAPRVALYKVEGAGEIYAYTGVAAPDTQYVLDKDGSPLAKNATWGLHAKTIVFDDQTFSIGTFNIDPRSANLNTEMVMICEGNQDLTNYVIGNIEARIQLSQQLGKDGNPLNGDPLKGATIKNKLLFLFSLAPSSIAEFLL